ncbi:hypothetical protein [Thalassotalea aquiviva]|uniref:hypothetical protein n=1 Tax=Thalassotalea aquiviva TaxID=3242415 RepID=UPI00352A5874
MNIKSIFNLQRSGGFILASCLIILALVSILSTQAFANILVRQSMQSSVHRQHQLDDITRKIEATAKEQITQLITLQADLSQQQQGFYPASLVIDPIDFNWDSKANTYSAENGQYIVVYLGAQHKQNKTELNHIFSVYTFIKNQQLGFSLTRDLVVIPAQ